MTNRPAIPLVPWFQGSPSGLPVDGVGGFRSMIPVAEPLSVGPPPFRPALTMGLSQPWMTRRVRSLCGAVITSSLETASRPTAIVRWTGLRKAQRDTLWAFLTGKADVAGGVRAFTLEPDGEGNGEVFVRPISKPRDEYAIRNVYVVSVDVEEVW
jgi:hypothetical protein